MQSLVLNSQTALKEKLIGSYARESLTSPCAKQVFQHLPSAGKGETFIPALLPASLGVLPRYIFIERSHISQIYFISTGIKLNTITLSEAETFLQN